MSEVVAQKKVSFIRTDDHELTELQKSLKKLNKDALEVLKNGINHQDAKIAYNYLKLFLEMQVQISKDINEDGLARVLAEVKHSLAQVGSGGSQDDIPLIDFSKVHDLQ